MIIEDVLLQHLDALSVDATIGRQPQRQTTGNVYVSLHRVSEPVQMTKDDQYASYNARLQITARGPYDDLQALMDDLKQRTIKGSYDSGNLVVWHKARFIYQLDVVHTEHNQDDLLVYDVLLRYKRTLS